MGVPGPGLLFAAAPFDRGALSGGSPCDLFDHSPGTHR